MYEMSTLKHAFNAKDMNSLVYRIVEGKVSSMSVFFNYLDRFVCWKTSSFRIKIVLRIKIK